MRFDILTLCMLASAGLGLAAPPKPAHGNKAACAPPSQPDRKVPAYGPPSPPQGPPHAGKPKGPSPLKEREEASAVTLPMLHRKITTHDDQALGRAF